MNSTPKTKHTNIDRYEVTFKSGAVETKHAMYGTRADAKKWADRERNYTGVEGGCADSYTIKKCADDFYVIGFRNNKLVWQEKFFGTREQAADRAKQLFVDRYVHCVSVENACGTIVATVK